jgi:hypothetical protein
MLDKGLDEKVVISKRKDLEGFNYGPYSIKIVGGYDPRNIGSTYSQIECGYQTLYFKDKFGNSQLIGIETMDVDGRKISGRLRQYARNLGEGCTRKSIIEKICKSAKKLDW